MANRDLEKRLAAIEEAIVGKHVELVFVPTRDLAYRVEKAVAKRNPTRRIQVVCFPLSDPDGAIEADLRKSNPQEAARLDRLLEGRIQAE